MSMRVEPSDADDQPSGLRFCSPWLAQLDGAAIATPLRSDIETDIAIVGAGIAGLATAYFVLRDTSQHVLLLEGGRAGHGASGRNAGQLVTYFERPLCDLVDGFGFDMATRGQAEVEAAWGLLDQMLSETGIAVSVERFFGAMGMFTLNHLQVHLKNNRIRRQAGLDEEIISISEEAPFLGDIPATARDLYTIVPQARIRDLLELDSDTYWAVLMNRKGCANSALLCQELLAWLRRHYPDRLVFADETLVSRVALGSDGATLSAGTHTVRAARVVLCTNGFTHHTIDNTAGEPIQHRFETTVHPRIGYMAGFLSPPGQPARATSYITNEAIGGKKPYFYMTRRPYLADGTVTTLTCLGGPETTIEATEHYEAGSDMPASMLAQLDGEVRPLVTPTRPDGGSYDFLWHGLMAYTEGKVRLVGAEPRNSVLMYNLGCNGVGFLPSIAGGRRIARLLSGESLLPSIFDPK